MITWNYMLSEMNLWEVGFYEKDEWVAIAHYKNKEEAEKKTAEYNRFERQKQIDNAIREKVRSLSNG